MYCKHSNYYEMTPVNAVSKPRKC